MDTFIIKQLFNTDFMTVYLLIFYKQKFCNILISVATRVYFFKDLRLFFFDVLFFIEVPFFELLANFVAGLSL